MSRVYGTKSKHSVDDVFITIKNGGNKFFKVSVNGLRILNFFNHGIVCAHCGRVGSVFYG